MDYILSRINNDVAICDSDSYEYVVSLRKRIEYALFFLVGYLWNKNGEDLLIDDRRRIAVSLNRMSIGDVVAAIYSLDKSKVVLRSKQSRALLEKYPKIRNVKIGHGYALSTELVGILSSFYDELVSLIPFLSEEYSLILVEGKRQNQYSGIRVDINGQKSRWICPNETFPTEDNYPRTYLQIDTQYYKISPFITISREGTNLQEYLFSSLTDSLTGQIKLCPLFGNTPEKCDMYHEFARFSEGDEYREVSLNGTVMNCFECNYQDNYQDVGFSGIVLDFLKNNKSNVSATLWGHGGVGKTACIQYVCQQLFCSKEKTFSYIVFVTAKDRVYNPLTGRVTKNKAQHIRKYQEIIETIIKTVYPDQSLSLEKDTELAKAEKLIREYTGKLLIVIDDYETFLDEEKQKISDFISNLNINCAYRLNSASHNILKESSF